MLTESTQTRLNDYLDGELAPAQALAFETELAQDPTLRRELDSVQAALDLLHTQGPVQAPQGFHERLLATVAVEPMPKVSAWDRARAFLRELPMETVAMAVAAAIVLVLVGRLVPAGQDSAPENEATPAIEAAKGELAAGAATEPSGAQTEAKSEPDAFDEMARLIAPPTQAEGEAQGDAKGEEAASAKPKKGERVATVELGTGGSAGQEQPPAGPTLAEPDKVEGLPSSEIATVDLEAQLNAAVAYRVVLTEPSALRQIAALAERHGGRAVNAATGQPLRSADLKDGAHQVQVQVRIPPGELTAFSKALAGIGQLQRTSMNDVNLYGPDTIGVNLDVRLQ